MEIHYCETTFFLSHNVLNNIFDGTFLRKCEKYHQRFSQGRIEDPIQYI